MGSVMLVVLLWGYIGIGAVIGSWLARLHTTHLVRYHPSLSKEDRQNQVGGYGAATGWLWPWALWHLIVREEMPWQHDDCVEEIEADSAAPIEQQAERAPYSSTPPGGRPVADQSPYAEPFSDNNDGSVGRSTG